MSKKEEQLLSPEDHERLAAAALESDVLRGRLVGLLKGPRAVAAARRLVKFTGCGRSRISKER